MSIRNLSLAVLFCLVVLLLQLRPNGDVDVFWRVKLGQLALEQGGLVRADPFTSVHGGAPVAPLSWLSEVFYAVVYRIGSWRLLSLISAMALAGGLAVAALTVLRRETSTLGNVLGFGLALLVALPHCEIRTQSFAVLGFALLLLVTKADIRPWCKFPLAAGILVIWQNMHPSVTIAAVTLAAMAGAGWIEWLRGCRTESRYAKPWTPTVLAALAAVCTVATPLGWHVFEISAQNARLSRALQISEWMPLWHSAVRGASLSVWVALLLSLMLLVRVRRRARLEDLAVFLVLGGASLLVYRFSLFFAVAMVPVWSRWITAFLSADSPPAASDVVVRPRWAASIVIMLLLTAMLLPWAVGAPVHRATIPLAAAERMHNLGVRGVVYNYREWGGPLIWAGSDDWKVTMDGRLYLFTPEDWRRYREIALGNVPVAQVEAWYDPEAFFLRPSYHRRFIDLLEKSDRWRQAHADENAVVFVKR